MSGPVVAIGENRRRGAAKGKHSGERQPCLARWAFLAMRSKPGCAFSRRYPTLYLVRAIIVRLGDLAMLTSGLRISLWVLTPKCHAAVAPPLGLGICGSRRRPKPLTHGQAHSDCSQPVLAHPRHRKVADRLLLSVESGPAADITAMTEFDPKRKARGRFCCEAQPEFWLMCWVASSQLSNAQHRSSQSKKRLTNFLR
jgi:hypothetical protein